MISLKTRRKAMLKKTHLTSEEACYLLRDARRETQEQMLAEMTLRSIDRRNLLHALNYPKEFPYPQVKELIGRMGNA